MRKLVLLFIFLFFLPIQIYAIPSNYTCIDLNNSQAVTNITINNINNNITQPIACKNGCNNVTGECNLSAFESGYWILLPILPLISIAILYLMKSLKPEDWTIHLLLMFVAIVFLIVPVGILQSAAQQSNNTFFSGSFAGLYQFILVAMIFVLFYYILKLIINYVRLMG